MSNTSSNHDVLTFREVTTSSHPVAMESVTVARPVKHQCECHSRREKVHVAQYCHAFPAGMNAPLAGSPATSFTSAGAGPLGAARCTHHRSSLYAFLTQVLGVKRTTKIVRLGEGGLRFFSFLKKYRCIVHDYMGDRWYTCTDCAALTRQRAAYSTCTVRDRLT